MSVLTRIRRALVLALLLPALLAPNDEISAALSKTLADGKFEERCAAAVAMGLSRHEPFTPELEKALAAEQNPDFKPFADAALSVLKGAGLPALRAGVRQLCEDELEREKFFGPGG